MLSLSSDEVVYRSLSLGDSMTRYQSGTSVREMELFVVTGASVLGVVWMGAGVTNETLLCFLAATDEAVDDVDEARGMSRFLGAWRWNHPELLRPTSLESRDDMEYLSLVEYPSLVEYRSFVVKEASESPS